MTNYFKESNGQLIKTEKGSYIYYKCLNKEKKGTIIFVHGFATTSEYHNNFIKYINEEFDYISIQLPGAGVQEWASNKKPKVEDMVIYCVNVIRELNLSNFILLGHSMGGGIVVRLSNIFKKETTAMICSTPMNSSISIFKVFNYFLFNPKTFKKTFKLINILYHDLLTTMGNDQEKIKKFVDDEFKYQWKHRDFFIKLKKSMFSLKNRKDCKNNETNITCPTLVIIGKYDEIIPPKSLFKAFGKLNKDNIRLEIMNKSAHIPFQEQEQEYAKEIKDFINVYGISKEIKV